MFERPPPKYSAYSIMKLLLDPNIDKSKIALTRPVGTTHSATFVVDLSKLNHPDDVKKDNFGKWEHSGSHPEVFKCSFNELESVTVEKCAPGASGSNVYYLRRLRSYCPSNHDVRRLMAFIHGQLYNIFFFKVGYLAVYVVSTVPLCFPCLIVPQTMS